MSYNIALKNSEGMLAELFAPSRGVSKPLTNGFSDWYNALLLGEISNNIKIIYDPNQKKIKAFNPQTNEIDADFDPPKEFESEVEALSFDLHKWWYG